MLSKGKILIAEPTMLDSTFNRTVVLLCEYSNKGSLGFVLNKKLNITVQDTIDTFPISNIPVFFGGPVQLDNLFFIHPYGNLLNNSKHIGKKIYWGGDYEKLRTLLINEIIDVNKIKFFIGYSGWNAGQLNTEMEENSWLVKDFSRNDFYNNSSLLWREHLIKMDDKLKIWANTPENYTLN